MYKVTVPSRYNKGLQSPKNPPDIADSVEHAISEPDVSRFLIPSESTGLEVGDGGALEMHVHFRWLNNRAVKGIPAEFPDNYCAVFHKFVSLDRNSRVQTHTLPTKQRSSGEVLYSTAKDNQVTVLVRVVQTAQDSNAITKGILPIFVGLRLFDDCPSTLVNIPDGSFKVLPSLFVLDHEVSVLVNRPDIFVHNGEAGRIAMLNWYAGDNNMVERGSKVVYEVTKNDGQHRVRLARGFDLTPDFALVVGLPNADKLVRITAYVRPDYTVEVYHVLLSPLDFEPPGVRLVSVDFD
mgnify:CR=1 FL=1